MPPVKRSHSGWNWRPGSQTDHNVDHLERTLAAGGLKREEAAPLITDLLRIPVGGRYPAMASNPEQRRRRLLAALVGWVFGVATSRPVVMVVEDLHWLDPSTLELLQLLAGEGVMAPLMLMYTARPEFHPQWPMRSHHTQITLNRLSARNAREMVARVAAHNALTSESVDTVTERTGGVPLFVEELTRAVLESGAVKLSAREIPVTLHDSLMARLDRLGSAKSVLQLGAVIGGEFSFELLRTLHPGSEPELESELRKLTDADLLYFRGIPPEVTYQFKHTLIRDAAYEALLKSRRKELHGLVARTIDEKFPDLKQAHPEGLARHWTEAGEIEPAIAEWMRAAKAAEARNAFAEAERCYEQSLALVNLLTESPQRDVRELELRQAAQMIFGMIKGWAAPETINATQRLTALAERSGNLPALHSSLLMRGFEAWFVAADYSTAGALADQALTLAQREGNPTFLASSYHLQLVVRFWRGDLTGVEQYFRAGLEFFDDQQFKQHPSGAYSMAFGYPALSAWVLGRPDLARERSAQMMAGVDSSNPVHLLTSAFMAGILELFMRQYEKAGEYFAQWTGLMELHQFADYGMPQAALGVVRAQLGRVPGGVVMLRQAMSHMRSLGIRAAASVYTVWLAEAEDRAGASLDALETIEQALKTNPDELMYRPEALRVRGELRAKQGATELAETDFREAIALAQTMGAKAWELRATMSLARLLKKQDRTAEARAMLSEVYGWFTEGFDTADLKDAKALLDELST